MKPTDIPVIAIDGPSASGKGTIAQRVAQQLDFHYLDSGALYRLVALKAIQSETNLADEIMLAAIAKNLDVIFKDEKILLESCDVSDAIRAEQCGITASKIAAYSRVRGALMAYQRGFCQPPGLVTDGRDMGSVIFPEATLKIFLTASAEVRADRRYKQLKEKGMDANMAALLKDIQMRDARDSNLSVAPLQQGKDSQLLDSTTLSIVQVTNEVLNRYAEACGNTV